MFNRDKLNDIQNQEIALFTKVKSKPSTTGNIRHQKFVVNCQIIIVSVCLCAHK